MKRVLRILAFVAGLGLLCGVLWFANSLVGNPISKHLATKAAEEYLEDNYSHVDCYIERVGFSFKDGNYYAAVESESSVDTHFMIYMSGTGKVRYDTYDSVEGKWNTARRLDQEYRELTDKVFDSESFPYKEMITYGSLEICPKEYLESSMNMDIPEYAMMQDDLEIDGMYDIRELGARAGELVLYIDSNTVTVEEAAQVLLEIKQYMDDAGVPFYATDFCLQHPRPEEGEWLEEEIRVIDFLYENLYEEGLEERIRQADEEAKALEKEINMGKW